MPEITVRSFADSTALAEAVTVRLRAEFATIDGSLVPQGVMLSGGSTPLEVFAQLEAKPASTSPNLRLFMSDERMVDFGAEDNNFQNASSMFEALGLDSDQLFRVQTHLDSKEDAAADYHDQLQRFIEAGGELPLGLLGLGGDGHTAGLFSAEHLAAANEDYAVAVERPDGREGISLTPELFCQMGSIIFVVAGEGKQDAVRKLLAGSAEIAATQAVADCPSVELWADAAALGN